MPKKRTSRPLAVVLLTAGFVAAACGSPSTDSTEAASESDTTASGSEADAQPSSTADSTDGAATVEADPTEGESDEAAEEAPADTSHLFPDLNTVNIVDGSTVNLADELSGGDTPVLLWFWAPH